MELAINKDCENIIEGFVLNENPRFESFVYQWMDTMFQRIYTAQSTSVEIIHSTNACIHYAKRVLSSKNTMTRLGALYLLYAIHFKQPTDRFHKIDISLTAWIRIKDFIFSLNNMLYAEGAKCIFWDLLKENSFRFVASDIYYGLENLVNLDLIRSNALYLSDSLHMFRNDLKSLTCRGGLFEGMTKLEDGYNEMKEMMNKSSTEEITCTELSPSKSFEELKIAFNKLNTFMREHCNKRRKIVKKAKQNRAKNGAIKKQKRSSDRLKLTFK